MSESLAGKDVNCHNAFQRVFMAFIYPQVGSFSRKGCLFHRISHRLLHRSLFKHHNVLDVDTVGGRMEGAGRGKS